MLLRLVCYFTTATLALFPCVFLNQVYDSNDLLETFYPYRHFLKEALSRGEFPLWNPYLAGGLPFLADPQTMMFYPFQYLSLLFPIPHDLTAFIFIHLVIALSGMHFFLNSHTFSEKICIAVSITYGMSAYFWMEIIHLPILAAFAWLPWLFGFIEKFAQTKKSIYGFASGLTFTLLFLAGSFQISLAAFYSSSAYFLFRVFQANKLSKFTLKSLSIALLLALWACLPLLAQLIPTYEFTKLSVRNGQKDSYQNFNAQLSLQPKTLYQFIFPKISLPEKKPREIAIQELENNKADSSFLANVGFLGIWFPLLAWMGWRHSKSNVSLFFVILGTLSILVAFGKYFFIHRFICEILPGFSVLRCPFRYLFLYTLSGCYLMALGLKAIELKNKAIHSKTILAALLTVTLFCALCFINIKGTYLEFFSLISGCLLLFLFIKTNRQVYFISFLFTLVFFSFINSLDFFKPNHLRNFNLAKNIPFYNELPKNSLHRTHIDNLLSIPYFKHHQVNPVPLPPNFASILSYRSLLYSGPLSLSAWDDLFNLPGQKIFDLFSFKYWALTQKTKNSPQYIYYSKNDLHYYEKKNVAYLYSPQNIEIVSDKKNRIERLKKTDLKTALLEDPFSFHFQPLKAQPQYRLVSNRNEHQIFEIKTFSENLVIFSEVNYPGWNAYVDGQKTKTFTANHLFRSIVLPQGKHRVEWKFEPFWFKPILGGLALWLLLTLAYFIYIFQRKRSFSL